MSTTITIQLPVATLVRYQHGAKAAHKKLEDFLAERLVNLPLPLAKDLPAPLDQELQGLDSLTDELLWEVARSTLSVLEQAQYDELLIKNSADTMTKAEQSLLSQLGQKARLLTLKKAHAFMLLQWRGYAIPKPDEMV